MKAILLINLGSPNSPLPLDVKKYLKQFLMDPFVIDIPYVLRWALVNLIILNVRPKKSAHAYQQIWRETNASGSGSPLIQNTYSLKEELEKTLEGSFKVEIAMRYGNPSIQATLQKLALQGIQEIYLIPLYPQFSLATTYTVIQETRLACQKLNILPHQIKVLESFNHFTSYRDSLFESIQKSLDTNSEALILSFHGLPERQILKTKNLSELCKFNPNCCEAPELKNASDCITSRYCYRKQCFQLSASIQNRLGQKMKVITAFQSRFGSDKWISPNLEETLVNLPKQGIKKVSIACPSFVSDCLETLEEVGIRGKESFLNAGGESFQLIPCLNADQTWAKALKHFVEDNKDFLPLNDL